MTAALVFGYRGFGHRGGPPGLPDPPLDRPPDRLLSRPGSARDGILYRNAEAAIALAGAVDTRATPFPPAARPGLLRLGADEQVLAVGLDAHLALADCQKSTLLAETLDLETFGGQGRSDDEAINGLLWSCLNTRRAVALGRRTWSAAQLLPFADLRFHAIPPLRWIAAGARLDREKILVIDHERASHGRMGTAAAEVRAALASYARVEVAKGWAIAGERAGDGRRPIDGQRPIEMSDLDAGLHLHVGDHTLASDALRLVDSWINRIPALHLRPRRREPQQARDEEAGGEPLLRVAHARNGFECSSFAEVLACYEDLRNDRVLWAKVTEAGTRTVAPLAEGWKRIAAELLDG